MAQYFQNPHKQGKGYKYISKLLRLSNYTTANVVQNFHVKGTTESSSDPGRPKKITECVIRKVHILVLQNRRVSASRIAEQVSVATAQPKQYIAHSIKSTYMDVAHIKKPLLKPDQKKAHMQFAKTHTSKPLEYWKRILQSDRSKIDLFGSDGVQYVWRQDYKLKDECILSTVKHGGVSVMVWGCMSVAGIEELSFIEGRMDSVMYCDAL